MVCRSELSDVLLAESPKFTHPYSTASTTLVFSRRTVRVNNVRQKKLRILKYCRGAHTTKKSTQEYRKHTVISINNTYI